MSDFSYRSLNFNEITSVLENSSFCRLCVAENNQPSIVPMYFTWKYEHDHFLFYLKSPNSGEKMAWMKNNQKISLEFENKDISEIQTVVVKGIITRFCEPPSPGEMVVIQIQALMISGRSYPDA